MLADLLGRFGLSYVSPRAPEAFLSLCGGVCGRAWDTVANPAGLEPATAGLEIRCSIQLSYGFAQSFLLHCAGKGDSQKTQDLHRIPVLGYFVAIKC